MPLHVYNLKCIRRRWGALFQFLFQCTLSYRNIEFSINALGRMKLDFHFRNKDHTSKVENQIYHEWQKVEIRQNTFYLHSSFIDDRALNGKATINIIGMANPDMHSGLYCRIWFENKDDYLDSNVTKTFVIFKEKKAQYKVIQSYLWRCPLSDDSLIPVSVSLVHSPGDEADKALPVVDSRPKNGEIKKNKIAVCLKSLYLPMNINVTSLYLSAWIEILLELGADKIFTYNLEINPDIGRVLKYYESINKLDLRKTYVPDLGKNYANIRQKKSLKWNYEMVIWNDCFYRNMYVYEYIAVFDLDEIPVKRNGGSWQNLSAHFDRGNI